VQGCQPNTPGDIVGLLRKPNQRLRLYQDRVATEVMSDLIACLDTQWKTI